MQISLENIGHFYNYLLFENINLTLEKWDFFALYGPSGVGKSTLLQIIGKIIEPKKWKIFHNNSLSDRKKSFWYAFVGGPFFEELTTKENILFLQNFTNLHIKEEKYHFLMSYFEMEKFEHTPVKLLSAGQRERVNIIRAMVHEPEILIIDEPGSNLDDRLFMKLFSLLENQKNTTICIATHDERYKKIANKTIFLTPLN